MNFNELFIAVNLKYGFIGINNFEYDNGCNFNGITFDIIYLELDAVKVADTQ
ncbi:hypothetical protein D3C71_2092180 [compost metagenome]